jgi:hypothetical protein
MSQVKFTMSNVAFFTNHIGRSKCRGRHDRMVVGFTTTYAIIITGLWIMMFNVNFNNISIISWQSVLSVEETRVPGENHQPVGSHGQSLSHNVVSSTPKS